jgi:PAS domain S-box-containing protein
LNALPTLYQEKTTMHVLIGDGAADLPSPIAPPVFEAALHEREEFYRLIAENTSDMIAMVDQSGHYVYNSPSFRQVLGYDPAELIGRSPLDFIHPDDIANVRNEWSLLKAVDTGQRLFGYRRRHADGSWRWIESSVKVIYQRGTRYIITIARDVSERKRAEEQIRALNAELEQRVIAQLQEAIANIKTLSGMLPICAACKKIRDDSGYWNQIETYIREHSEADFSHSICPDCSQELYSELYTDASG